MTPIRAKQELPSDIVAQLMSVVRNQFYGDAQDKVWFQDRGFILRRVVTWPAAWLNRRGVTLPPARYKAVLLDIFDGIKSHGSTGAVKYWPGYLAHCVQEHFKIHGEEYYEEGKSIRASVERAKMAFVRDPQAVTVVVDPVEALAQAHAVLASGTRRKKMQPAPKKQLSLFDL